MAFLTDVQEICELNKESEQESLLWQEDYPEFQRLADNELLDDFDEILPEVNDGSLSAALFKLPKRIVSSRLTGRAKAEDRDDAWVTELANIVWESKIIPNANTQAPFHRKWKDAVRKAAIYGSVPLITLFVERGRYIGSDFIVAQPQDVRLGPGAVSDYDSDVFFWDVYYPKLKLEKLLERAEAEDKAEGDNYNKWNIPAIKKLLDEFPEEEDDNQNKLDDDNMPKPKGVKLTTIYQRGVGAPFYLLHPQSKAILREWENPDPSGDVPVHFLYCYQDFENPYGTGIVKLAGGTQNVLDLLTKSDVLATQLGFRPPIAVGGDTTGLDIDSLVYSQDAIWEEGNARVERREISNQIYSQLPTRMEVYKNQLYKMIPMGDTSVSAAAGDPLASKTPAGVKATQASLSLDDDDFKDNLYMTYEAKARSMINTHFANMQGNDLLKLSDEEREILAKAGLEFPVDEMGQPTNELDVVWDNARADFTFELDAEQDKAKDDETRLEGLLRVYEIVKADPNTPMILTQSGKRFNEGELISEIIHLTSDNDKILEDISPEDQEALQQEQMMAQQQQMAEQQQAQSQQSQADPVQQIMQQYGVDEQMAMFILDAAQQGFSEEEIAAAVQRNAGVANV